MFRYKQIAQELRVRIESGEYPTGRLPAERTLSEEFGVQRDTLRRALEELIEGGVLRRDAVRGTYVAPREPIEPSGGGVLLILRTFEDSVVPSAVLRGLSQRLGEAGLAAYGYDPGDKGTEGYLPPRSLLIEQGIQGVVLWPDLPAPLPELRALRAALPIVLVDRRVPGFDADFVGFQDFAGGRAITEHLLRLGHRRIGFVSGEPQASAVQARVAGYTAALEAAGVPYDPALVLHQEGGSRLLTLALVRAFLSGGGDPITAVVCANDTIAARLIQFIHGLGLRMPGDVAVTGFGNLIPSMMDAFGITTVAQPFQAMGAAAGDLLLERLRSGPASAPSPAREVLLNLKIIVRSSCGSAVPREEGIRL